MNEDIRFKLVSLVDTGASPDRANVDHSVTELNKGSTLLGELHIRNIFQAEVHQVLVLVLTQPLNEAVAGKRLAQTNRRQPILGEAEVEETGDIDRGSTELLLLLRQVGAANEANGTLVAQLRKELEHFRSDVLLFNGNLLVIFPLLYQFLIMQFCANSRTYPPCWRQSAVDIKQANGALHRAILQGWVDTCGLGRHVAMISHGKMEKDVER